MKNTIDLINGIERADSVTIDLPQIILPADQQQCFYCEKQKELLILKHHADYLNPKEMDEEEIPAQINKSITQSTKKI